MFTWEEINDDKFDEFITQGARDTTGFDDSDTVAYWTSISGKETHNSKSSKIADVRYPILRVLHKMIVHGFHQRTTHWDKAYTEDLVLLRLFHQGGGVRYANAPYSLADFMVRKASGKMPESRICCGQFITRIGRNLGLLTRDNIRECSRAVHMDLISWGDLSQSGLLTGARRLIPEGERQQQVRAAPRRQRQQQEEWGFPELRQELGVIRDSQLEMTRRMGVMQEAQARLQESHIVLQSQQGRMFYDQSRYQPYMEEWAQRAAEARRDTLPPYTPPDIFIPNQFQGGFVYPPRGHGGDAGAGSSGAQRSQPQETPQFGQYQGGSPSIFPHPDDMDQ